MKRIIFSISLITGLNFLASAQTEQEKTVRPIDFTIGAEVGFPFGNNAVEYAVNYGLTAQAEYKINPSFGVTARTGYINYTYKTVKSKGDQGFIPVLAGVKFYISPRAFFSAQAGAAFCTETISVPEDHVFLSKGTFFAWAPGIGHKFGKKLDGEFKFLSLSNSSHQHVNSYSLRLAYTL